MLTSLNVFTVGLGSDRQIVLCIFIEAVSVKLQSFFEPYILVSDDVLAETASWLVLTLLFMSLLISTQVVQSDSTSGIVMNSLSLTIVLLVMVLVLRDQSQEREFLTWMFSVVGWDGTQKEGPNRSGSMHVSNSRRRRSTAGRRSSALLRGTAASDVEDSGGIGTQSTDDKSMLASGGGAEEQAVEVQIPVTSTQRPVNPGGSGGGLLSLIVGDAFLCYEGEDTPDTRSPEPSLADYAMMKVELARMRGLLRSLNEVEPPDE